MPTSMHRCTSALSGAILLVAGSAIAQTTAPFWSSSFGGSGLDEIVAIRRGPGSLITLVGYTQSTDLPVTAGCVQPTHAGSHDVFVARLDPALPPANRLLWCTYLGGSGIEFAFDAEVDAASGITTVVGLTASPTFPGVGGPMTVNGPSDGFVVQLDANGTALLGAMLVGGSSDDRCCDVEIAASGLVTVAGVTSSTNLPATAGTVGPTYRGGGTDAFVAQVVPMAGATWLWATYLGGSSTEGVAFSGFNPANWPGNLDRMALAVDPSGRPVLATASFVGATVAVTTSNALQAMPAGASDAYVAVLEPAGPNQGQLHYGTFLGGPQEERPRAIACHPAGGYVVGGLTFSGTFPVTTGCCQPVFQGGPIGIATDGFLAHLVPGAQATTLAYSTFLGGSAGEDALGAIVVASSGRVVIAGYSAGGNFPTTVRCMQPASAPPQYLGFVARLEMAGNGSGDLQYSSFVDPAVGAGSTVCNSVLVDEVGDVFVAGGSTCLAYPQVNPVPAPTGGREGVFTHVPLLPHGVFRDGAAFTNPACGSAIYLGVGSAPAPGASFEICATNAPPLLPGILVLGTALPGSGFPLPAPWNGTLLVSLIGAPTVFADALGGARFLLAIPAAPAVANWGLAAQWFFFTGPTCPGTGLLANSERLNF